MYFIVVVELILALKLTLKLCLRLTEGELRREKGVGEAAACQRKGLELKFNKLASLEATLVQNYDFMTDLKCRAKAQLKTEK